MRKFTLIFIVFCLFFLFSCSSSNSSNDSDILPDIDTDSQDSETVDDDSDTQEAEIVDDSDAKPDADTPEKVECLDLRYNENTIKTPFPFKDANGKPTFCRPGCDTPTENDPQCVRNIWEWDNWSEYQVYLKAEKENPEQYGERECYPWPCKLPDMTSATDTGLKTICDRDLTVHGFRATLGAVWNHGMSSNIVGMGLTHTGRIIEYLPNEDYYVAVGQNQGLVSFNKDRYIAVAQTTPSVYDTDNKSFIISILKKDDEYFYEFVYDNENHNAFLSRPSFVSRDWVLIQVCDGHDGSCDVKYAKADNWEWHSLNIGKVQEGNIVDDRLSFIIHDGIAERQIYYCDLSKYPSSIKECTKVTRKLDSGYELGHSPRIDENDKNKLVFYSYTRTEGVLVEVKFEDGKEPVYKEIVVGTLASPQKIEGNLMMVTSVLPEEYDNANLTACFYRFDKKKLYCPVEHDWPTEDMAFPTFSGKWQLYKGRVSYTLRDWECYCKENNVCPFEDDEEENSTKTPLQSMQKLPDIKAKIEQLVTESKTLPVFDESKLYFCIFDERSLNEFGIFGHCPTAEQTNKYLKLLDKSEERLKDLFLGSKSHWKSEKSFADLVKNHKKHWDNWHECYRTKNNQACEYDEETSTFDSDSVMFATVIDHGRARDGIFFRDRFYEANGNFAKVIKELRQKFGASLRGMPRIEVKENKDGGVR